MDRTRKREGKCGSPGMITALTLVALTVRLILLVHVRVIETDSAYYGFLAGEFARGNLFGVLNPAWPPLYPVLSGLLSKLNGDIALSAQIVSAVAGTLLVPIVFRTTRTLFGYCAAVTASTIVAFHPRLIMYSELFLTESLYTMLFAASMMLLVDSLGDDAEIPPGRVSRSILYSFLSGVSFFLLFITRPEGLVLFAATSVFLLVTSFAPVMGFRGARTVLTSLIAGFLLLFIPFAFVFHSATGRFLPGEKGRYNFYVTYKRDYMGSGVGVNTGWINRIPPSRPTGGDATGGGDETIESGRSDAFFSEYNIVRFIRNEWGKVVRHTAVTFLRNVLDKVPSCEYHPLFLFTILGLVLPRKRRREELLLGFVIIVFILSLSLFFPLRRFFVVLLPILSIWAALGFIQLVGKLPFFTITDSGELSISESSEGKRRTVKFVSSLAVFFVLLSSYSYARRIVVNRDYPDEYRAAGEWLRESCRTRPVLSSRKPEASFYARAFFVPLPVVGAGRLPEWMKEEGVTHVLIDDRIMPKSHRKLTSSILKNGIIPAGLRKVYDRKVGGHRVVIFALDGG